MLWVSCIEMTWLLIHMKQTRYTSHFIWLVHINDYRTCGLHTKIYDLHVIGVITLRLYLLHNCKLRDVCTICAIAIYEIGTIVLIIAQDFSFTPS